MAKIWVEDNSVNETTAAIGYETSYEYFGDSVIYIWFFSGGIDEISTNASGTLYLTGLKRGQSYNITASVIITIGIKQANGEYSYKTYHESVDDPITVCTHPGKWHWADKIKKNDIIQKTLTADLVNEWVDHLAAVKSWQAQKDRSSDYEDYYDPKTEKGYRVESGDIIYLEWFNNCAYEHPNKPIISHENDEDIISIETFSRLDFNGTGE